MKFYIATDHAGIDLKNYTVELLKEKGHDVIDLGPFSKERVDYPDYAVKVAQSVLADSLAHGILICGSGIGMSMAANRHSGIRAALCHDAYTATVARGHNDANVLCFGERIIGKGVAESVLDAWIAGSFEGGRHCGRVEKIEAITAK
ncbi:MAG: ribose 5-phosphate isomerase B [Epsilonproteobacteria bacterium]|nr:ribose 5-phosphate isomerase B [Campylobacterota bacterium]OIO16814.1 MAG: ribose 5-phosphate isomerase B [Helicobacteraceae bacterium CG1_02_36_14]PIP09379.1 MAG: ribose 5-phosphate isomerase B [Sulfurimonas sp. CG23_combo_of_CG06-09_8_20_14_all_36_33]PIS26041.1 MAG: ribose 5-phosphate isomerase B [Sulfurimonas sp. CG08_land_8_20_14_0_20_36_33]PIU35306.1 MAG: ribose 5-phosphate isomerase B [Sulfurimonas sp. CG07_land_8_20_14_0_80_36_56]PIV02844.1 MAG: ribose 5-phosphate isomerase B [Sulfur